MAMARSIPETKLRVTAPWRATYDPALRVTKGERVTPGRVDDEYPGWHWVVNAAGLGGWAPDEILNGTEITEDFDTQELTVAPGEYVVALAERAAWLWCRNDAGQAGWVPKAVFGDGDGA